MHYSSGKQAKALHCGIFTTIATLVDELGPEAGLPYGAFVVDRCVHFFKRLELSSVKTATFNPVFVILEWSNRVIRQLRMDVSGVAQSYQKEFSRNKTLSPTVKGGILQVIDHAIARWEFQEHILLLLWAKNWTNLVTLSDFRTSSGGLRRNILQGQEL